MNRMIRIGLRILNAVLLAFVIVIVCRQIDAANGKRLSIMVERTNSIPQQEEYDEIAAMLEADDAPIQWKKELPEKVSTCSIADITFTLTNKGKRDAEWIEASVEQLPGDIAVFELSGTEATVVAGGSGSVKLKLITTETADATRLITISYYVHGEKCSVQTEA